MEKRIIEPNELYSKLEAKRNSKIIDGVTFDNCKKLYYKYSEAFNRFQLFNKNGEDIKADKYKAILVDILGSIDELLVEKVSLPRSLSNLIESKYQNEEISDDDYIRLNSLVEQYSSLMVTSQNGDKSVMQEMKNILGEFSELAEIDLSRGAK